MEGLAPLAVASRRVVLAVTGELLSGLPTGLRALHQDAAGRVPVALAPPAHREIRHCVVLRPSRRLLLTVNLITLIHHVQTIEHHPNIRRRHPILQHRRYIKIRCTRTTLQRAKRQPRPGSALPSQPVRVRAPSLLLVGRGHCGLVRPPVNTTALAGVELERLPCHPVVGALVNSHGIRTGRFRAELQADVRQLVLLPEGEGQGDVVWRRVVGRRGERGGPPAGDVVGVVQVCEVERGLAAIGAGGIAHSASGVWGLVARGVAEALGAPAAADGGGDDGGPEGGVDEVGDAAARARVVVARVGGGGERERRGREQREGQHRHVANGGTCGAVASGRRTGAARRDEELPAWCPLVLSDFVLVKVCF